MAEFIIILLIAGPAAIGQTYFVYRYFRYSTWRRDRIGRALMVKSAALGLLVNVALFSEIVEYFSPDGPAAAISELIGIWAYLITTVAIWWQLAVLLRVQKEEKTRKKEELQ